MNLPIIFVRFLLVVSIFGVLFMDVAYKRAAFLILFLLMMDILYKRYYTKYPPKSETTKSQLKGRKKKTIA